MSSLNQVRNCFINAKKDEEKGRKHKGLLVTNPNHEQALDYIKKAKENLEWCNKYKEEGADYKLPEEWFYTIYYCALAILSEFGIESRNQKCIPFGSRFLVSHKSYCDGHNPKPLQISHFLLFHKLKQMICLYAPAGMDKKSIDLGNCSKF